MELISIVNLKQKELKKYTGKFNFVAFDSTTSTIVSYNPNESAIKMFDCELELQKIKNKLKVFIREEKKLKKTIMK